MTAVDVLVVEPVAAVVVDVMGVAAVVASVVEVVVAVGGEVIEGVVRSCRVNTCACDVTCCGCGVAGDGQEGLIGWGSSTFCSLLSS